MRVEDLDHLGEVGERTGQTVHLVYHHDIDQPFPNMREQLLQGGPLDSATGESAIVVGGLDQAPALTDLAPDEGLTCLALRVQGVEVLLKTLLGGICGCKLHNVSPPT